MADKNIGTYGTIPLTNSVRLVVVPEAGPGVNVDPALLDPDAVFPIEFSFAVTEGAALGEVVWSYAVTHDFLLPVGLAASQGYVRADPALNGSFTLYKNAAAIGSVLIAANVVSFDFTTETAFAPGDGLSLVSEDTVAFSSLALSFRALRNN